MSKERERIIRGVAGNSISAENLKDLSLEELQSRYSALCDSIVALQSTDTPSEFLMQSHDSQQARCNRIKEEIKRRGHTPVWS